MDAIVPSTELNRQNTNCVPTSSSCRILMDGASSSYHFSGLEPVNSQASDQCSQYAFDTFPDYDANTHLDMIRTGYDWSTSETTDYNRAVDPNRRDAVPGEKSGYTKAKSEKVSCKNCGISLSTTSMRRHQREIHGITTYLINSKSKSSVKKSVRRCTQTEAVSAAKQANIPTATLPPLPYTTMDDPISMSNHIQADLGCLGSNETVFDHTETAAHLFTYMPTSNRPYSSLEEPTIGTDVDATLDEDLTCRCTVSARLTGVGRCRYCREVEEVEWMFGVIARKREKRRNAGLDQTPPAEQNFCGFCGCHKRDIESSDVEARCDCGDSFPLDLGPSTRRR